MLQQFERLIAFRYLRSRRQEGFISVISWFSLLGIALGVATLIIVMAVMNGFRAELFARILGLNGHLNVYSTTGQLQDWPKIMADLADLPRVVSINPMVEGQALASVAGEAKGVMVRGLREEDFAAKTPIASKLVSGVLAAFKNEQVAIGQRLATRLGLQVGDPLTLISPVTRATPFGSMPRFKTYQVGIIFDVGMFEYDNNFIFMPLAAAQEFFRLGESVHALEIFVQNPQQLNSLINPILDRLPVHTRLLTWQQNHASFVNALQVERNVMFLILTLIIVVAAFNIISGMIMMVKDKGRDIAILRTMGATQGSIMRIFMLSGASIGVIGTGTGALLGILFAENIEAIRQFLQALTGTELFSAEIYFLSQLPAKLDWQEVWQVVLMALTLSFGATLYPAWRAAKLDPVEALRYE